MGKDIFPLYNMLQISCSQFKNVLSKIWQARPILLKALETRDLSELVDPRLEKHYVEGEMIRMIEAAAACVRHSALKRPRMAQVILRRSSTSKSS